MCETSIQGIDLKLHSIQEAWENGVTFQQTRQLLCEPSKQLYSIDNCKTCNKYDFCHGGCQFFDINMCRTLDINDF